MRVRVRGEVYRSPDEALAEADELEARLDDLPEFGPQRRQLESHIKALRAAAREANAREAARTKQPKDRPRKTRRQLAGETIRRGVRRRRVALRSGASGRVLRETGVAPATSSLTSFVLKIFGLLLGLALLVYVLERESEDAPSPFTGLATMLVRGVAVIAGPKSDPFSVSNWITDEPVPAPASPSTPRRRQPAKPVTPV